MQYWTTRYDENRIGWDVGYVTTPLKQYIDQLKQKDLKILLPGAGNAYEAEYLYENGFKNVFVLDIAKQPLQALVDRVPNFPKDQLIHADFFAHVGAYDLILEQTFFCTLLPTSANRFMYAQKASELLTDKGKLVGLWFDIPKTNELNRRPFGGDIEEYIQYFSAFFETERFERCYNSIESRQGFELFGIFDKHRK